MNRTLGLAVGVAALALVGVAGWLLLAAAPPARPVKFDSSTTGPVPVVSNSVEVPAGGDAGEEPEPAAPVVDPDEALPADGYPWAVPDWWFAHEKVLREKEVHFAAEHFVMVDLLRAVGEDIGVPVRAGPELEEWARARTYFLPRVDGPARALLELIATSHNLDIVLQKDGVVLHQRGRELPTRLAAAGRVQWTMQAARDRLSGERDPDPAAAEMAAVPVELAFERLPLRDAMKRLEERLTVPVYLDRGLWTGNPEVSAPAGERPLGEWLNAVLGPIGARAEALPRRVVVVKP